jgi:lipopolysaccharide assembly protein A
MANEPGPATAPVTPPDSEHAPEAIPAAETLPEQTAPPRTPQHAMPQHTIKRTRISGAWVALFFFTVVLLLLLIFILQNSHPVDVSYFGAHGHLPLGVALLLAAVCGVLLVAFAGSARIVQLRATARRHRRADAAAGAKAMTPQG